MDTPIIEDILVFKTSITNPAEVMKLSSIFDTIEDIEEWNVDIHDCDHVLRVVSSRLDVSDVIKYLNRLGYYCAELEG